MFIDESFNNMIQEKISRLRKEIDERNKEIDNLENIIKLYPDAIIEYKRGGGYYCCSTSVNNKANKVIITHSCGCCSDASLVAFPYIETKYGNIYSNPRKFHIGERFLNNNWKDELLAANISNEIIDQIKSHMKQICDEALEEAKENAELEYEKIL